MKKIFFCAALLLCCLSAKSQFVIDERAKVQSLEDLNKRMKLGDIAFGDSITWHLFNASLKQNNGGGNMACELKDYERGFYRIGKFTPFMVMVDVKAYLINGFVLSFLDYAEESVRENLIKTYGKPTEEKDGQLFWFATNVCIMAQRTEYAYMVIFKKM